MIAPPFTARCSIVQRAFKATTLAMCWRSGSGGASARSTRKRKVRAMADRPDFHVITGGPGSGKSTLIEALAVEGFDHMPEAGRALIRDQVAIGGAALPWAARAARSEEHTSELQSLMRNSSAVFCFNNKSTKPNQYIYIPLRNSHSELN